MSNCCPLCFREHPLVYTKDQFRTYFKCSECQLIFVDREQLVTPDQEKHRYEAHQNDEFDPGYHSYLKQISSAITPYLTSGSSGLDFGCGRTTLLGSQFTTASFPTDSYDVYFLKDESIWAKKYDFIVLSEVIEHLREPRQEMERLGKLLKPRGRFFIKTKFAPATAEAFDGWFYKRDLTHVQFFNQASMTYLKSALGMTEMKQIGPDLCLLGLH